MCTVICASGTYTALKFHVRLPLLQMVYVVGIHLTAQRWLLGMLCGTFCLNLAAILMIIIVCVISLPLLIFVPESVNVLRLFGAFSLHIVVAWYACHNDLSKFEITCLV